MASDPFVFPYTPPGRTADSSHMLSIYLLRVRPGMHYVDYEEFESFVVVDFTNENARRLVHDYIADHRSSQDNSHWMDGRKTSTLRIGKSTYWLKRTIVQGVSRGS